MKRINITALAESQNLDLNELATQLFPSNQHPRLALNRVIADKGVLDAHQISKLALLTGLPISDLFTGGPWKAANREQVHVFTNNEFTAELDTANWTTRLFHNKSMFHEHILHDRRITLSEYLNMLNSEILKFNQNAKN